MRDYAERTGQVSRRRQLDRVALSVAKTESVARLALVATDGEHLAESSPPDSNTMVGMELQWGGYPVS